MDCRTARLLIDFHRARAGELAPPEAADLEGHLAVCAECDALTRAERRADARLAQAMAAVPLPDGLRDRLRDGLRAARRAAALRKLAWAARAAAVAAVLLLVVLLVVAWRAQPRPLDLSGELEKVMGDMTNPDPERVEGVFAARYRVQMVAPRQFDYTALVYFGMGECQKKRVPVLVFARGDMWAMVYVVTAEQFNLKALGDDAGRFETNGFHAQVARDPEQPDTAFVIIYTGDSLAPVQPPSPPIQ
jgi:hypothetical protein